jgi:peptidoglycan L-alanyl-D-glutamate endopeptidase CwlK
VTFVLGARSERNLIGVHPDLVRGVRLAITRTPVDFGILDGGGLRTPEQAAANAAAGTGILRSLHLMQPDGYGHAVDLVAFVDGKPSWEHALYRRMQPAIFSAFDELGIPVQSLANRGDWPHWQLPPPHRMKEAIAAMVRRKQGVSGSTLGS